MRIVRAEIDDAEALTGLHLAVWEEAYAGLMPAAVFRERRASRVQRIEKWRQIIGAGSSATLLAWSSDDRLLGFSSTGAGRSSRDDGLPPLELMALYVRADVYGAGVGHALLEAAIGEAPAYLWVLDGNERAIRFYERQGLASTGRPSPRTSGWSGGWCAGPEAPPHPVSNERTEAATRGTSTAPSVSTSRSGPTPSGATSSAHSSASVRTESRCRGSRTRLA